ncbi:hypothetical protein BDV10DRAFT_179669 [Aspergillus recurvatus]
MTSTSYKSSRVLAPLHNKALSGQSLHLPKRTNHSNACTACKARKTKCHGGQPCTKCVETGSKCIFDKSLDRRRKYALKNAEQKLRSLTRLLDQITEAFDAGDKGQLSDLLSSVRGDRLRQAESHKQSLPSDEQSGIEADLKNTFTPIYSVPSSSTRRASVSLSAGSIGPLDDVGTFSQDLNCHQKKKAVGYMCNEYEISRMQKPETKGAIKLSKEGHQQPLPADLFHFEQRQLLLREHSEWPGKMLSPGQMNVGDAVNYGPDCAVPRLEHELQQRPVAWDPVFFSVGM